MMSPHPDLGPWPALGYTANKLDRAAVNRNDAESLSALAAHASTRFYVVGGELIVLKQHAGKSDPKPDPLFTADEANALGAPRFTVFLGIDGEAARFGFGVDQAAAEAAQSRSDFCVSDLRSIAVQGLVT